MSFLLSFVNILFATYIAIRMIDSTRPPQTFSHLPCTNTSLPLISHYATQGRGEGGGGNNYTVANSVRRHIGLDWAVFYVPANTV